MSSLRAKDRVSLCQFMFADGRRCRTPRTAKNPHFCFDHAQKEARAHAVDHLGRDLDYFFSADYLSACDLSTALGRLLPAVIRGDVKPKVARTVAYLAQTPLQTIRMSQHEYINAFDTTDWRNSIRNSVNGNHIHRFPPAPKPELNRPVEAPLGCHSERSEESAFSSSFAASPTSAPAPFQPQPQPPQTQLRQTPTQQPAPSPHTPMSPTSTQFAEHVVAGLQTGGCSFHNPPLPRLQLPLAAHKRSLHPPIPVTPHQPPPPQPSPSRDTPWWDFGRTIPPDSHLL